MQNSVQREKIYQAPALLLLQFLLSFLLVSVIVVRLVSELGTLPGVAIGCGAGLLLTANLSQGMFALQVILERQALGLPVELVALWRYWPLTSLFELAGQMERWRGQQIEIEQQTVAYKDQLMQQVIEATAQEERNRLARDLHDSIKQQIFSITMSAAAARARWDKDLQRVRSILDDIERTAREAQVEMQAMLQQLRPRALENTGLIESLRMQSQALEYRTGASVTLEIECLPTEDQLPPGVQEVLFRIVQEGFANIARHARASHVWLCLYQQEHFLILEIGDDGQGFDIASQPSRSHTGGMGMQNIHERIKVLGGTAQVWSMVGQGTTLQIALPLLTQKAPVLESEQAEAAPGTPFMYTRRIFNLGLYAIDVAASVVLLDMPAHAATTSILLDMLKHLAPLLIGPCLFVAIAAWLWAQHPRMQVALSIGRDHLQHLALLAQGYKLLCSVTVLSLFYLGYVWYAVLFDWPGYVMIGLALLLAVCYYRVRIRYGRTLALPALQELVHQQRKQLGLDFLVWTIVVGYAAFSGIIADLHAFHFSGDMWVQNAALSMCLLWLLVNLLKSIETICWQRLAVKRSK
ncbi:sensor histidine kinase [Dictyobacter formicarum]|uniref:Oxygen sensor histidine kinase NreB n=1 Tax=Dictyobacter formicarum TaxID=2778368 RepID=A0ABQ3VHK9_9CHLR|nr:sensor histidine kinase [Dictyobacter formicarum]GHO85670.1 hypothetical protein KSZ_36760 [Dictyobacter formicarum]